MRTENPLYRLTTDEYQTVSTLARLCVEGTESRPKAVDFVLRMFAAKAKYGGRTNITAAQQKFLRDLSAYHGIVNTACPVVVEYRPSVQVEKPTKQTSTGRLGIKMPRWSRGEEDVLIAQVAKHGLPGLTTASEILGRSWASCRAKYRHLMGEHR